MDCGARSRVKFKNCHDSHCHDSQGYEQLETPVTTVRCNAEPTFDPVHIPHSYGCDEGQVGSFLKRLSARSFRVVKRSRRSVACRFFRYFNIFELRSGRPGIPVADGGGLGGRMTSGRPSAMSRFTMRRAFSVPLSPARGCLPYRPCHASHSRRQRDLAARSASARADAAAIASAPCSASCALRRA